MRNPTSSRSVWGRGGGGEGVHGGGFWIVFTTLVITGGPGQGIDEVIYSVATVCREEQQHGDAWTEQVLGDIVEDDEDPSQREGQKVEWKHHFGWAVPRRKCLVGHTCNNQKQSSVESFESFPSTSLICNLCTHTRLRR